MALLSGPEVARGGDGFDALYETHRAKVFRVILRMVRNPSDAEDLTQETFLKVKGNLPHLTRPDSVSSWVYRIASNTALDHLRATFGRGGPGAAQRSLENTSSVSPDSPFASPTAALDTAVSVGCVREYAHRLPERYGVVLVLHDLEGLPLKRVAEVMGSSVGATKVRLHRARRRFAEICAAECEQFYNEEGILCCQPRSVVPLMSLGRRLA